MESKVCTKCGINKPLEDYHKHKLKKDGLANECKACKKKYYNNNKEYFDKKHKVWCKNNAESIRIKSKIYKETHKEEIEKKVKEYRANNKEKLKAKSRKYYYSNLDKIKQKRLKDRQKNNTRERNRRSVDINFRLSQSLRARIRAALKLQSGKKAYKSIELLGCTIKEYRKHLEKQFTKGMSWVNYGEWQVDHRIPCKLFDLTDPAQQKACFHYLNLQPLWAEDNLKKRAKSLYLI